MTASRSPGPTARGEAPAGEVPFVSVVIPMRNEERHVGACLRSLAAQDYPGDRFEVIVVDGGEDDEFHFRLLDAGGRVLLTPSIRSTYYARRTFWELARQYFGYGQAKVVVLTRHPRRTRLRQLVPSAFVLAALASVVVAFFGGLLVLPLAVLAGAYVAASVGASLVVARRHGWRHLLRLPPAFAGMHLAYGLGFLSGLLRRGLGQPVAVPREAEAP